MNYEDIFAARGDSYHAAMQRWPDARRDDFLLPLQWLAPVPGETLIDVPAGGGYMRGYLPEQCDWHGHEPCASFAANDAGLTQALLPLPFIDRCADCAISIAGVHHLDDKGALFKEIFRALKPGGRFLLADVHRDSAVAGFLDDFVGQHTSTGHRGDYLGPHTLEEMRASGFSILRAERVRYAWWFSGREDMDAFCSLLFALQPGSVGAVADAVERRLGTRHEGGEIGMNWELYFVLATRNDEHGMSGS